MTSNFDLLVKALAVKTENKALISPSDYVENGLIMCGECHTPRQTRIKLSTGYKTVFCLCKCRQNKRDEDDKKRETEKQKSDVAVLLDVLTSECLIDPYPADTKKRITFDRDDKENAQATSAVKMYVNDFETYSKLGQGLLMYGGVGTGKSFFASCIVSELLEKGYAAAMTSFSRIEGVLWGSDERQNAIDKLCRLDLIAIDDLFAERDTEFVTQRIFWVIDTLIRAKVPLVVTTNLTLDQLNATDNISRGRILSRLQGSCVFLHIGGKDRRKEANQRNKRAFIEDIKTEVINGQTEKTETE